MKKNIQTKSCQTCQKIFEKKIKCSQYDWENTVKYCSKTCVNKNRHSPFKGKKRWSEEFKQNLSNKMKGICFNTGRTHIKKGQHLSPSTQFKKGNKPWCAGKTNPHFTGPKNPKWKGGVYPERLKIRHSVEMKRWRLKVFERDNYTCVLCLRRSKAGDKVILHADHHPTTFVKLIEMYQLDTFEKAKECEKFWDASLGRTLCKECHLKTDTHGVNLK